MVLPVPLSLAHALSGPRPRLQIRGTMVLLSLLASTGSSSASEAQHQRSQAEPRAIHEKAIVLDTHLDTPANFARPGWSIMDRHDAAVDGDQVDLPRMIEGGVDGGFFAIYTPSAPATPEADRMARDFAVARAVEIREMIAGHQNHFRLALTEADATAAVVQHKRFVFISMENGQPFEGDLSLMRMFRALGVTMMGPVHRQNNGLADSATDKPRWQGLSARGAQFVAEANRLGIVIDLSHASDETLRQAVRLSKAPVILSHSGMRAVYDHPRNLSEADARLVADHGGIVSVTAFNDYMVPVPDIQGRTAAMNALARDYEAAGSMTATQRRDLIARRDAIDKRFPVPRASLGNFMDHLLHVIRLLGVDHVGISGDLDGGGGVTGLNDVADYPHVTEALLAAGYGETDIAKLWGGNMLRLLGEVQALGEHKDLPEASAGN